MLLSARAVLFFSHSRALPLGRGAARPRARLPGLVRPHVGLARLGGQEAIGPGLRSLNRGGISSRQLGPCEEYQNKIYLGNDGKVYAMASADQCVKSRVFLDAPKEDDLVEGILKGVEDYKAGKVTNFKSKEELLDHLKSL